MSSYMGLSTTASSRGQYTDLEVNVDLKSYGLTGVVDGCFVPFIRIESTAASGSMSLVRRSVERLDKLVKNRYEVTEIRYTSSYAKSV